MDTSPQRPRRRRTVLDRIDQAHPWVVVGVAFVIAAGLGRLLAALTEVGAR